MQIHHDDNAPCTCQSTGATSIYHRLNVLQTHGLNLEAHPSALSSSTRSCFARNPKAPSRLFSPEITFLRGLSTKSKQTCHGYNLSEATIHAQKLCLPHISTSCFLLEAIRSSRNDLCQKLTIRPTA
uniref:HTH arsR-type domain-containing protein n=1 Tax=Steinernema glaseri TaxID=37863 RepID=A0A1I7ZMQ2_9BILA